MRDATPGTLLAACYARFPTIRAFAAAAGLSVYHASNLLHGRDFWTFQPTYEAGLRVRALLGLADSDTWGAAVDATQEEELRRWQERHPPVPRPDVEARRVRPPRSPIEILIDRACGLE